MRPETFHDLAALVRRIETLAPACHTISFDIFDTLLVRRVHDPDLLKDATCRFIASRTASSDSPVRAETICAWRDEIEARHRLRNGLLAPDREARYPDFMRELLARVFGSAAPEDLLEEVTAFELEVEASMLVPRAPWRDLLAGLRRAGKRVLAVSDIYLPSPHLRVLLDKTGLLNSVDRVYSSADHLRAKASGSAFAALIEADGLSPRGWLHIGDNPISDGVRPAALGIQSLVLRDAQELKRKLIGRACWKAARRRDVWKGRLVQQLMLPLEAEAVPRSERYETGFHFFGPLYGAFIHHVAEQARARGLSRLYFLSREGRLFMDIWERLAPALFPRGGLPEAHYLHVSRMALAPAVCGRLGLTDDLALIAFLPRGNRDMRDLARICGFPLEAALPHARRYGLEADTPLSGHYAGGLAGRERLRTLLRDDEFQSAIREACRSNNDGLMHYLESERFFGSGAVGIVDIGWLGTIQRFLHDASAGRADCPTLHGFLFAATRGIAFPTTPANAIEGWFHDGVRRPGASAAALYYLELFEESCRAAHPGLMAYERTPAGFALLHRAKDDPAWLAEQRQSAHYAELQQGVRDAASRYAAALRVTHFTPAQLKPWLEHLAVSRLVFPTSREVESLRFAYHLNDFDAQQAQRTTSDRFRGGRLWTEPLWRLRYLPGLRLYHLARHTGRQLAERLYRKLVAR